MEPVCYPITDVSVKMQRDDLIGSRVAAVHFVIMANSILSTVQLIERKQLKRSCL
jgi:hypothetical protein